MRVIEISDYNYNTMELAKPIYDQKGRILLAAGNAIHPKYLQKLLELGITYVVVEDTSSRGITLDEMVDMPTWIDAIKTVQQAFEQVEKQAPIPIKDIQVTASKLLQEVKVRKAVLLVPSTSTAKEIQPYAHAVNVALIALQMGKQLQYNDIQQRDLAIGCLLHDIGKAVTSDEAKHPFEGFTILRSIREFNLLSAHIAYQHHEKVNGTGYPRQLKKDEVLEFAQVCSVANRYEQLLSIDRVPPYEAVEKIMSLTDVDYKHSVVNSFFKGVPSYLPGTSVRLSTGETGIVTRINSHLHRPCVRVEETGKELSLADDPTILIKEELNA
ncbi:HD-GYP domain-containing protein [Desertibacillus haloalkaliphilus]|uniref:HD-GYP domain-containing protein n=1 Tax=Desertibacillus haloalkaliphilus TaxID=1328930 RepID=UPI001C252AC1|nr:HD domain-containing protein [Desertibacillus haloalkaliphilus]MBU8907441.1 HD domain-containing protein [Desertibacillus haloalkaliphilus]